MDLVITASDEFSRLYAVKQMRKGGLGMLKLAKSNVTQSEYCRLNKLSVKVISNWRIEYAKESRKKIVNQVSLHLSHIVCTTDSCCHI
jgi:hypothetical protein